MKAFKGPVYDVLVDNEKVGDFTTLTPLRPYQIIKTKAKYQKRLGLESLAGLEIRRNYGR